MKLWMVESKGWGVMFNIVRAETREAAITMAKALGDVDVTELAPEGDEAILWSYDYSPDTGDD